MSAVDQHSTEPNNRARLLLGCCALVASTVLLLFLGEETRFTAGKSLAAQPRFWPAISLTGMWLFSILFVFAHWRAQGGQVLKEVWLWLRALEYLAWFMAYVYLMPMLGYLPATLLFMCLLTLRLGYRNLRYLLIAAVIAVVIVLFFKTALAVKIPGGAIYEYLPDSLRNFMIINF